MASRFLAIGALAALAQGATYYSADGSARAATYENSSPSFRTLSSGGSNAGEYLLNFDTTGATNATALPVTILPIAPGRFVAVVVQWDQPDAAGAPAIASGSIDLCVQGTTGGLTVTDNDGNAVSCTGPNPLGADPYRILSIVNPAGATGDSRQQTVSIVVGLAANSNGTRAPDRISVAVEGGTGSTIDAFATGGANAQAHLHGEAAPDAATAAAAPPAPTLTLAATTIDGPGTTVISWSSVNALYCTPTGNANTETLGSWIGTLGPSGEYTQNPTTAGTYIFTLTCSNAAGTSPPTTATLTVIASPNSGSTGAFDGWTLLGLAALTLARRLPRSPYFRECRRR